MSLRIVTNNQERLLLDANQLTEKELADFDWLPEGGGSFFRYRGDVYCLSEFTSLTDGSFPQTRYRWEGYVNETVWSGVLVRYGSDYDHVIVARYLS